MGQESVRSATLANYNTAIGHENMAFALDNSRKYNGWNWALYSDTKCHFKILLLAGLQCRDGRIFSGNVALGSFAMQKYWRYSTI